MLLSGCGTWFGEPDAPPLPGERISVLQHQRTLAADPQAGLEPIVLPPAVTNPDWPQAGGNSAHAMHNLQAGQVGAPGLAIQHRRRRRQRPPGAAVARRRGGPGLHRSIRSTSSPLSRRVPASDLADRSGRERGGRRRRAGRHRLRRRPRLRHHRLRQGDRPRCRDRQAGLASRRSGCRCMRHRRWPAAGCSSSPSKTSCAR